MLLKAINEEKKGDFKMFTIRPQRYCAFPV